MPTSSKLIELANTIIGSSVLDLIGANYSIFDTAGRTVIQNKLMQKSISTGEVLAEDIDKPAWENCKMVMKGLKRHITEENFQGKVYLSIKQPLIENNECIGILIINFDITDRKQAEIAKQECLQNMAHDLMTPLAGIIGLASLQAEQGANAEEQQTGRWIVDAGEQLLELLNSVIKITTADQYIDSVNQDRIDLVQLVEELQLLLRPALQSKSLNLQLKLDGALPVIISDRVKLKQILLNLLSNATKFTKQGTISLEVKQLAIENAQVKLEMRVMDTGIGIATENLAKIFDRFYRAHSSSQVVYKGYGVGLFLVKTAVELLGGEINVTSEEGVGSCFILRFNFPVAEKNREPMLANF